MQTRRDFLRTLGVGAAALTISQIPFKAKARTKGIQLTILHTNDFHSHIDPFGKEDPRNAGEGGMARRAALIAKIRAENENVLLFDSGDIYTGTPYFNFYQAKLSFELMNRMGYDAATLGNHEFDNGLEGIASQLPSAKFPFITSNYDFSDTILAGKTLPYKIFKRSKLKIGVYGLGVALDGLVDPRNSGKTRYLDPIETALKMETLLKKEHKCNLIICLSHLGYSYKEENIVSDRVLAAKTNYTNLILGGHTHTFLKTPERITNKRGKEVVVNQAGFGGLIVGRIDYTFNKEGKKRRVIDGGENIPLKG